MINALRHIVSKAKITLDHYFDVEGDIHYNWSAEVDGKPYPTTTQKDFQSLDDCIRDLIEQVTPKLEEKDK